MTLTIISFESTPSYLAVSGDIVGGKITGATIVGATVYLTDIGTWKIIADDLTLVDYVPPFTYIRF